MNEYAGGKRKKKEGEKVLCTHQWLFKLEEVIDDGIGEQLVSKEVTRKAFGCFFCRAQIYFVLIH